MKYKSGEKVYWRVWILFILMLASWVIHFVPVLISKVTAIRFYSIAITNKFLTPDQSQALNRPCVLFGFFDDHDVWHFLSSVGLILLYLMLYFLDMDIADKPCSEITVF